MADKAAEEHAGGRTRPCYGADPAPSSPITLRLSTLSLPDVCRSATHALGVEVLAPALRESVRYDRAVGFFSSSAFSAAPSAFGALLAGAGQLRLVCSPVLGSADIGAIHRALVHPAKALADLPRAEELARRGEGARALAAWIAAGRVKMQVAVPSNSLGGIYHEKIALFTDAEGNQLALSGSANESMTAWKLNFERVDVFPTWTSEEARRRCWQIGQAFEDLWRNRTDGLQVIPLHEALLGGHLRERGFAPFDDGDAPRGLPPAGPAPPEVLAGPPGLRLFPHQEAAIGRWAAQGGRGILAMATGAGKTLTALSLAVRLASGTSPLVIMMIAPYIHLIDQWVENARRFGLRPIRAAEARTYWEDDLAVAINAVNAGKRPVLSIAVTQATLSSSARFKELLRVLRAPALVIGDEVHNYGSLEAAAALPTRATYRLGLSATPERHRDIEGTRRVTDYFGPVVFRYGLEEAIRDEVLTPYRYYPIRVELEADELERYLALSKQLARYVVDGDEELGGDLVMRLLLKRARILASARQKMTKLEEILTPRRADTHILVYCGDGQVDGPVPEDQQRQVEAAVNLIGNQLGMRCASYTAATPPDRRRELLSLFASGQIQVLVAIRCLDEGVDVPSTRTAIVLASSTNPRQFIQRRGRILRRAPGKTRADLFDLVVCPDLDGLVQDSPEYRVIRSMLRREFQRAAEFAALALNGPVARQALNDITARLQLHDGWYTSAPQAEPENG